MYWKTALGFRPWSRHSLILITAGLVYIGAGVARLRTSGDVSEEHSLYYADQLLNLPYWGFLFIAVGIFAIVSARWPFHPKNLGYAALTGCSAGWASFYIIGFSTTPAGYAGLGVGLMWALVAFMWWGISGLVSPSEVFSK